MKCSGCQRELEIGDQYITDTATGFLDKEADPAMDVLIAEIMGGSDGKIIFCEDCTSAEDDGRYLFDTVYGDEEAA